MNEVKVGLIGFGTVGAAVAAILRDNASLISERMGGLIQLSRVAEIEIDKLHGSPLGDSTAVTTDAREVIEDPDIHIVIELVGGIEPARSYMLEAMQQGKHVVTANKALLAEHGPELSAAARAAGVRLGIEASVGGGIPIIRSLGQGLIANNITSIFGILNGTSNYILSRMTEDGAEFDAVLQDAQKRGYAEADPTFDVEGIDAAHKLAILGSLGFGIPVEFTRVFVEGIAHVTPLDIQYSLEFGYRIKLLAIAKCEDGKIELRVHPTMVPAGHLLSKVRGVYNAVYVTGDAVGSTMFYGQGAGGMPTGSAIVGDVVDVCRDILRAAPAPANMGLPVSESRPDTLKNIEDVVTPYYLRFTALDRPGVLSTISGILGSHEISIESVIQKGRRIKGTVPIVMMTHEAKEQHVRQALQEIDGLNIIRDRTNLIRVESDLAGDDAGVRADTNRAD